MKVSVIIPCYKSRNTLSELADRLVAVLSEAVNEFEILLVVDGSPDDTWTIAQELSVRHGAVEAIGLSRNYGQHNALVAGVRAAKYPIIVTMDDDLQHPPEQIPALLGALTDDLDVIYAVPFHDEHGRVRNAASRGTKAVMARALRIENARHIGAFRAFRTQLRDGFQQLHGPNTSLDVALSWCTTRVGTVRLQMAQRRDGESNYSVAMLARHATNMVIGYSVAPLRAVTALGFLSSGLGAILLSAILWMYVVGRTTVPGFTTLAAMIALFSGAQMLAIGVLGEYIGRVHLSQLGRPGYVVREHTDPSRHVAPPS